VCLYVDAGLLDGRVQEEKDFNKAQGTTKASVVCLYVDAGLLRKRTSTRTKAQQKPLLMQAILIDVCRVFGG
jgi:hypothetical protein